jgi:hypothetical protein
VHLLYDVQADVKKGDYRSKERLQKIIKDHGDIEYHELKAMIRFKTIQNGHTKKSGSQIYRIENNEMKLVNVLK